MPGIRSSDEALPTLGGWLTRAREVAGIRQEYRRTMPRAQPSAIRRWARFAGRLIRDLEGRTKWHDFKVGFAEWAEVGTLYERPRQGARQRAARLRGDGERWR